MRDRILEDDDVFVSFEEHETRNCSMNLNVVEYKYLKPTVTADQIAQAPPSWTKTAAVGIVGAVILAICIALIHWGPK